MTYPCSRQGPLGFFDAPCAAFPGLVQLFDAPPLLVAQHDPLDVGDRRHAVVGQQAPVHRLLAPRRRPRFAHVDHVDLEFDPLPLRWLYEIQNDTCCPHTLPTQLLQEAQRCSVGSDRVCIEELQPAHALVPRTDRSALWMAPAAKRLLFRRSYAPCRSPIVRQTWFTLPPGRSAVAVAKHTSRSVGRASPKSAPPKTSRAHSRRLSALLIYEETALEAPKFPSSSKK